MQPMSFLKVSVVIVVVIFLHLLQRLKIISSQDLLRKDIYKKNKRIVTA